MKTVMTRSGLGAIALISALTLAACAGSPASSLNPTGPSSAAVGGSASFNPNPDEPVCEPPDVTNPRTNECEPPPPPPGNEGCTPGFWKANVKAGGSAWTAAGYAPGQMVGSVFAAGGFNNYTLLAALEFGGGPAVAGATQNLLRAAVAAVLNAAHNGVAYPQTVAGIRTAVNNAISSGDRDAILALAAALDANNNLGCPLNNSRK